MKTFYSELIRKLHSSYFNVHDDNYCEFRYGPEKPSKTLDQLDKHAKMNIVHKSIIDNVQALLDQRINPNIQAFEAVYCLLSDEASRQLMVDITALNFLGYRKVKVKDLKQYFTPEFMTALKNCSDPEDCISVGDIKLQLYDLSKLDCVPVNIKTYLNPLGVVINFIIKQYSYHVADGNDIEVKPGDYVIDGGACCGETSLYFAEKTGETGKVFSFEFIDGNVRHFNKSLSNNPELSNRIVLDQHPLWMSSGAELGIRENGAGSRVVENSGGGDQTVTTISIDDFTESRGLEKMDFIKMDIEGAEVQALQGAEKTIRKFRPKLAICVYHNKYHDMLTVPLWLSHLKLGYKFYLKHATNYTEETVLFAQACPDSEVKDN